MTSKALFYHWGPLLMKTKVEENNLVEVEKLCNKRNNFNHELAGHMKEQFTINPAELEEILKKYLQTYKNIFVDYYHKYVDFYVNSSWVNYMKSGEFNPPHCHGADFSAVLFLSVPEEIKKENEDFKGTGGENCGPGELKFFVGLVTDDFINEASFLPERGDLFVFPSKLIHLVAPFKSNVQRISVAFNMTRKQL